MWDFYKKCNFQNTFPYRKITVCTSGGSQFYEYDVCLCVSNATSRTGGGR